MKAGIISVSIRANYVTGGGRLHAWISLAVTDAVDREAEG